MALTAFAGVTEIARLTGKTRPTVYKYIRSYEEGSFDDIPYSFLMLLRLADGADATRDGVLAYCTKHFGAADADAESPALREITALLREHADRLDLAALKQHIEKEIQAYE